MELRWSWVPAGPRIFLGYWEVGDLSCVFLSPARPCWSLSISASLYFVIGENKPRHLPAFLLQFKY